MSTGAEYQTFLWVCVPMLSAFPSSLSPWSGTFWGIPSPRSSPPRPGAGLQSSIVALGCFHLELLSQLLMLAASWPAGSPSAQTPTQLCPAKPWSTAAVEGGCIPGSSAHSSKGTLKEEKRPVSNWEEIPGIRITKGGYYQGHVENAPK